MASGGAAGPVKDIDAAEAWVLLGQDRNSQLIDVRTRAELTFVGAPVLESIGKRTIFVEWQSYPDQSMNPGFVQACRSELQAAGADERSSLLFICRSGARSLSAARAMQQHGYQACHNVAHGFEGPVDATGHRGATAGLKKAGLPWAQG